MKKKRRTVPDDVRVYTVQEVMIILGMDDELAAFIKRIHPKAQIMLSFDGIGTHDWLRQHKGSEESVKRAIRASKDAGLNVKINMNVNRKNRSVIFDSVKMLTELGVDELRIIKTTEAPRWQLNAADASLTPEEYYDFSIDFAKWYSVSELTLPVTIWQSLYLRGRDLFPDTMTAKRLQRYINSEEPPVVVSNVNYGKRIIACIQTDDMSFDLKASVEAEALGGKIKGDAEAEYKEKLSNCTVKVFAIGGSSKAAGEYLTMSVDDLMKAARSNTAFDGYAVPVSYTTRWAKDGSIARTNYTGYNWETVEMKKLSDSIPVSFKFEPIDTIKVAQYRGTKEPPKVTGSIDHLLTKGMVSIYGRKIVGVNADGSLVRSDEQLLKTVTFDYETMDSFKLSGDVLADSVKFVFDYEGYDQNKRSEAERTILLKDACGGLDKISKYEGFELEVTKSWGSYDPNDVGFIMGTCRAKEKDSSNKKAFSVKLDREEKNTCPML